MNSACVSWSFSPTHVVPFMWCHVAQPLFMCFLGSCDFCVAAKMLCKQGHASCRYLSFPFLGFQAFPICPLSHSPLAKQLLLYKLNLNQPHTPLFVELAPSPENMLPWEPRQIVDLWIIKFFFYLNENLICYEWFIIAYAKKSMPEITI